MIPTFCLCCLYSLLLDCSALRSITIAKDALQTIRVFHLESAGFFSPSFLDLPFFTKLIVGENSVIGLTEGKNELVMEGPFVFPL